MTTEQLLPYVLQLGDTALIHGQRLGEWCGYGPVLEQDIALTNIALDHIGQARMFYQLAAILDGKGRDEDYYAMKRDVWEFKNPILVELPNGHWGDTIAKCFFLDTYNYFLFDFLKTSKNEQIAAIAQKAIKEIAYHAQFASEWVIRLGDGTETSHQKIQTSIDQLWEYTSGLFEAGPDELAAAADGVGPDLTNIKALWDEKVSEVLSISTIKKPMSTWMQKGGKYGDHTEHLGFILSDLQFLQRAYPDAKW
jgi:ring-1,2-phenylacetyl-CoA epoxidase subunit PaaC